MQHREVGKARVLVPLALSLLMAACQNALEPAVHVHPMLETLTIETAGLSSEGILRISAAPQDARFSAAANERIPVLLRTETGETKNLLLRPAICPGKDRSEHSCDRFLVVVKDGFDVQQLESYAAALPGRLSIGRVLNAESGVVWTSRSNASVVILEGDLDRAMARARRWPNVQYVEYSYIGRVAIVIDEPYRNYLTVAVAEEFSPTAGGNTLHLKAGEKVSVEYEQPDGSRLSTTVVLPPVQ